MKAKQQRGERVDAFLRRRSGTASMQCLENKCDAGGKNNDCADAGGTYNAAAAAIVRVRRTVARVGVCRAARRGRGVVGVRAEQTLGVANVGIKRLRAGRVDIDSTDAAIAAGALIKKPECAIWEYRGVNVNWVFGHCSAIVRRAKVRLETVDASVGFADRNAWLVEASTTCAVISLEEAEENLVAEVCRDELRLEYRCSREV